MMRSAWCALATVLLLACDRDASPPPPGEPVDAPADSRAPAPRAELLLEAGDSTYWLRSGPEGIRLRGSPVLLARLDGRFHELYVADEDRSFYDAVFVGQRLWRRDLLTGDSTVLLADTLVDAAATRWARRHPDAQPLEPDEDESADPSTVATGEIEVLDVIGPWGTIERHTDIDVSGEPHRHALRREVIDLRTGQPAPLAAIVGPTVARAAFAEARVRYAAALDSVRRARDERGRRAARAIAGFPFDSTSFGLATVDGALVVTFLVPGNGDDAGGYGLPLAPVPVASPAWWRELAPTFPRAVGDSIDRWLLDGIVVEALWQGGGSPLRLVMRDGAGGRWVAGHVAPPPRWLLRLDAPPVDAATRRALARAFDESALYSDEARTALRAHTASPTVARPARGPRRLARPSSHPNSRT